jgi:tetratricopeptide (TPR) repeat protein
MIGLLYQWMENNTTALQYFEKTRVIQEKSLSCAHLSLAVTHFNIAAAFHKLCQFKESIAHAIQAVNILRYRFGSDHPHLKFCENYLGKKL